MSDIPLPDLQDTLLDRATLEQLFIDLGTHAKVLDVLAKGAPNVRTDARPLGLDEARDMLLSGATRALQVRYLFDEKEWRDTLMRVPDGIRLVRIETVLPQE